MRLSNYGKWTVIQIFQLRSYSETYIIWLRGHFYNIEQCRGLIEDHWLTPNKYGWSLMRYSHGINHEN